MLDADVDLGLGLDVPQAAQALTRVIDAYAA